MRSNGALGEVELLGDAAVGEPSRNKLGHLLLPEGK